MDAKVGEVWLLSFAGEYFECPILQVTPAAVKTHWCVATWLTRQQFADKALCRVGRYVKRHGWRRLFGKQRLVRD